MTVSNDETSQTIFEIFEQYFSLVSVDNLELLQTSQRLRYSVYCVEHHFEEESAHPDQIEVDIYDSLSAHTLLRHQLSEGYAATVRLVLPKSLSEDNLFPIESHSDIDVDKQEMIKHCARAHIAEISRFAVSKTFRKRLGEAQVSHGLTNQHDDHDGKRLIPHITLGLFKAIVKMSIEHDIHHWYAVMEVILIRLLKRFGIYFTQIGPAVE